MMLKLDLPDELSEQLRGIAEEEQLSVKSLIQKEFTEFCRQYQVTYFARGKNVVYLPNDLVTMLEEIAEKRTGWTGLQEPVSLLAVKELIRFCMEQFGHVGRVGYKLNLPDNLVAELKEIAEAEAERTGRQIDVSLLATTELARFCMEQRRLKDMANKGIRCIATIPPD